MLRATQDAILRVCDVRKSYRSGGGMLEVLRGVDFTLEPGGFAAVIGQSGSGKSTLLHLMGLLDAPDSGQVHLDGTRIDNLPAARRDRLRNTAIGMVFQSYHLLPDWMRVRASARERARGLLDRFGLGGRLHHKPRQLSGGEMQRVAIARALVTQPRVLLADEPTGNLDEASGGGILDALCELNRRDGLSIVLVTHDAAIARRADRIVRLAAGRVADA
jgi:lipoprotein-releasing system ATP-binding protein